MFLIEGLRFTGLRVSILFGPGDGRRYFVSPAGNTEESGIRRRSCVHFF